MSGSWVSYKKCPQCDHRLEIETIILVKNLFEIEIWNCHHCKSKIPKRISKNIYQDISSYEFKKEREKWIRSYY